MMVYGSMLNMSVSLIRTASIIVIESVPGVKTECGLDISVSYTSIEIVPAGLY